MFKQLAPLAAAVSLFAMAPDAQAASGYCYDAKDDSRICYRYIPKTDGELVVAVQQPGTYWPSAIYVTCWDDGSVEYYGWGGLSDGETRATALSACDAAYD